ncbi:hypothetical protein GF373_17285, partial [bacterium]|nr:hypothetical protein [bacterium]
MVQRKSIIESCIAVLYCLHSSPLPSITNQSPKESVHPILFMDWITCITLFICIPRLGIRRENLKKLGYIHWVAILLILVVQNVSTSVSVASTNSDSTTPLALEIHATINSAGIVSPFAGDDNSNNSVMVYYRPVGSATWQESHPMSPDRSAREWRGSLIYLTPDTLYEIQVQYQDPDGVSPSVLDGTFQTRPDTPLVGGDGVIRTVSNKESLESIIDDAEPGDTIQLLSGVYNQNDLTLRNSHSGEPGQYLTIEPAPGATVIFDGSDLTLNSSEDDWSFYASSPHGDIYYVDLPWGEDDCGDLNPGYVGELRGEQSVRYLLFDSGSADWEDDFMPTPAGKAFYVCDGSGPGPTQRLYVVTYEGDDPDSHEMQVARYRQAIHLKGADYIRVRGIEFRYYSSYAILIGYDKETGSDHNIIENNVFHGIGTNHIRLRGKSGYDWISGNLIQNNHFYEEGYRDSGWEWEVAYLRARAGVVGVLLSTTGHGNIVRGNRFDGGHDGIHANKHADNTDVYDNIVTECMDDGIEVDSQPGQNIRVWNNRVEYCYVGISLQDWNESHHGPVYVFRNVLIGGDDPEGRTDHKGGLGGYATYTAFKVGSDTSPDGWAYIYHNTVDLIRSVRAGTAIQDSGGNYFANAVTRNN